jgi:hypothetical protein
MRFGRGTPFAVLLVCGCVWPGMQRPDSESTSFRPSASLQGGDAVGLQIAVLEVPIGDRFVNSGLWATIDEQVVPLDRKSALVDNGFRVGLVGGLRPEGFDDLLKSPRANANGHWAQTRAGHAKVIPLGGPRPLCEFRLTIDDKSTPLTAIEKAQCALQVTPTLQAEGGIKLAFVPLVQHGSRPVWTAPIDGAETATPADTFPDLGWEVTVAAGEFVVVGTQFEKAGTLGHACFVDPDGLKPVQRLLAVRAVRAGGN